MSNFVPFLPSLPTFVVVLEITGSLRNLGKALKNVMKKKNSSDIVRKMTYSVDNATAETNSVLEPIRAMISHQHNLKKRAENAEAKWSEAVRKNEMLEALLDIDRDTRNMNLQQTLLQKQAELTIFVSTWNVGNNVPQGNLSSWLGEAQLCDIVAIGVQECTYHVKSKSEKGFTLHATGKKILKSVAPTFGCANNFEKLIQRHLGDQFYLEERVHISGNDSTLQDVAGIRLFIFVKKRHAPWVRSVSRHCVKRGIKVTLNKGAVACSIIAYGTRIAFINSHFHAHQDKVEERNSDYKEIARKLFTKKCSLDGKHPFNILTRDHLTPREPGCCHHVVFWMGDLNYRIELPHENVVDYIAKCQNGTEEWRNLFAFDQLNTQRQLGKAFYGYKEFPIDFMPTYKLNDDRTGYDLGRTPSWCDRIFVKSIDGINLYQLTYDADCMIATSDHHPVTASYKLQAPLPIFDSSDLFSSAFIHLRKIKVTFFRENDIGSALSKHYASLVQRCDQEGYSISPEESDTVILAYEGEENPEDISLIASYITLTCCGTMIERIVSVDWVNKVRNPTLSLWSILFSFTNTSFPLKTLSLGLHMNVAQTLSQFPEPISLGIWVCKPKQITPRPSQKSVRIGYEDNMTAAEDVPPSPSPSWHGAHDNLENLIMDNYDLVGEAVIETKDLFSVYLSQNRNISNFNTTLLYGGVKVGSVAGQMNISSEGSQEFHDISICSTDN